VMYASLSGTPYYADHSFAGGALGGHCLECVDPEFKILGAAYPIARRLMEDPTADLAEACAKMLFDGDDCPLASAGEPDQAALQPQERAGMWRDC